MGRVRGYVVEIGFVVCREGTSSSLDVICVIQFFTGRSLVLANIVETK